MKLSVCYAMLPSLFLLLLLLPGALGDGPTILTFEEEGLPMNPLPIADFYNGGGGPTVNYGIFFSGAYAVEEGGNKVITNLNSESVFAFVPGGFSGSVSFEYYSPVETSVALYNNFEQLIRDIFLPAALEPIFVSIPFSGTATFVSLGPDAYYDNLAFNLGAPPSCPAAEIWDPTTNAYVEPLEEGGIYCLTSYNLRAVTCDETASLVDLRLANTESGVQIRRQKETVAPYFLWGDDTKGDVFKNQKQLPNGSYLFRVTINGVNTDYAFTQSCTVPSL